MANKVLFTGFAVCFLLLAYYFFYEKFLITYLQRKGNKIQARMRVIEEQHYKAVVINESYHADGYHQLMLRNHEYAHLDAEMDTIMSQLKVLLDNR